MKTPSILIGLLLTATPAFAQTADEYYNAGVKAMNRNDPATARTAFEKALQLRPDHPYARYKLAALKTQAGNMLAKRKETELGGIRLPEVEFRDVTLSEALSALNSMVETESTKKKGEDDAFTPNFMVQDPTGKLGDREVSLSLKNIPAKAALDYLLQQAGGIARYDEHAIVIRPASGAVGKGTPPGE
ncbi:hypothetical protein HAHE_16020 [Haloferula helveola]|uniref:Tetratricopeptide repeat protein n=1 Tax=Haloferula helveola TaxID=490095 RepID=A0ABN6H5J5_9BACT|nr:hypothetical protein HAHE_16020 [Haloferula helveola]